MKILKLESLLRAVAILVAVFLIALTLLFLSDHVVVLAELFNPHSKLGGASILILLLLGVLNFFALALLVPCVGVILCRCDSARTLSNVIVLLAGAATLGLIGLWLIQVMRR